MNSVNMMRFAALTNIVGIAIFSKGFTNTYLSQQFPELFGPWGWVLIMVWGLAYASVARTHASVPGLLAVFAVEKAVYVFSWFYWLLCQGSHLPEIWRHDVLTAIFYSCYGAIDLAFGVFFFARYRASR